MTEKEQKIFDMQSPSMKAIMQRPKEKDVEHYNRPIPVNYLAIPDAKTIDELVGMRALTFEESKVFTQMRQHRGQILAEMRNEPDACAHPPERKHAAVQAFMFIKRKFHELMQEMGLATEKEVEMVKRHEGK
jgi:hypothetical protein